MNDEICRKPMYLRDPVEIAYRAWCRVATYVGSWRKRFRITDG